MGIYDFVWRFDHVYNLHRLPRGKHQSGDFDALDAKWYYYYDFLKVNAICVCFSHINLYPSRFIIDV